MRQQNRIEVGRPNEGGKEAKEFNLEEVERCALDSALKKAQEVAREINAGEEEAGGEGEKPIILRALDNIKNEPFDVNPEFAAIYLNAATGELRKLQERRERKGIIKLNCDEGRDHNIEEHINALTGLIDFFQKRLAKEYN